MFLGDLATDYRGDDAGCSYRPRTDDLASRFLTMTTNGVTVLATLRRRIADLPEVARSAAPTMSVRQRRLATALVVVLATAISVWLRLRGRAWLIADMVYDDALFTRSAGQLVQGNWLGPYDMLTLSKGPTYPLFIAGAYELHVPLKLAEHGLHLFAAGMLAWAVWRVTRVRVVTVAAYVVVALNPAYLGSAASRVTREVIYGALSLILVSALIVFLSYVPGLVTRGWRWSVPAGMVWGLAIGVTAAAYYLCREERSWLAPAVVVAVLAGTAGWGRIGRAWLPKAGLAGGAMVLAVLVVASTLQWVAAQNEKHYGAAVVTDLVEGEIANAYAQWQRVDVGEARRFVVVTRDQRRAVYGVSAAATEMRRALERHPGPTMWSAGCILADVCDDYTGAQFIWALRLAAARTGHMESADETYAYFSRIADDIEAACGVKFECHAQGFASMPPLDRIAVTAIPASLIDSAWYMARFDVADPNRVLTGLGPSPYTPSGGSVGQWATMSGPLRGISDSQVVYRAEERAAMKNQEFVRVLWFFYRWGALAAALLALVGLAASIVTHAWRRHLALVLTTATLLAGLLGRLAVVALVDATAYPAAGNGTYQLPGVDFYVAFGAVGTWLLVTVVREVRERARSDKGGPADEIPVTPAVEDALPAPRRTALVP